MAYSSEKRMNKLKSLLIDGKTIITPIDDRLIFGPEDGLFDISRTVEQIAQGVPNAFLGFRASLELLRSFNNTIPFIYNLTASTIMGIHTKKVIVGTVEYAKIKGATCVAAHVNFTSKFEENMLHNFAMIAEECDRLELPLLAIAYPRREWTEGDIRCDGKEVERPEREKGDNNFEFEKKINPEKYARLVRHCVSSVCELGADMVKTYYTGTPESFELVVKSSRGVPVVTAGGPKVDVVESLRNIEGMIKAGGAGISFGRNVFNQQHIVAYLQAAKSIIFESKNCSEALQIYDTIVKENVNN